MEGKWYNQILNGLKAFFNMDITAGESEIHQKMTEYGTYEQMEADIRTKVEADLRTSIADELKAKQGGDDDEFYKALTTERDALQTKLDAAALEATQLKQSAADLKAEVEKLNADAKTAADRIAVLEKGPAAPLETGKTDPPGQPKSDTPVWDAWQKRHGY